MIDYSLEFAENCTEYSGNGTTTPRPEPVTVVVDCGETAQKVMEGGVDEDRSYVFTATYQGMTDGYVIDSINGTENTSICLWHLFYKAPDSNDSMLIQESVTAFVVPDDGGAVILRYQFEPVMPTPTPSPSLTPTPTPTPSPSDNGAAPLGRGSLVFLLLCAVISYLYTM